MKYKIGQVIRIKHKNETKIYKIKIIRCYADSYMINYLNYGIKDILSENIIADNEVF